MRCLAIDDEPLALALLADNISKVPYLHLVAACNDAFEAISILQTEKIDLIFTDIQMPGITGLQFIEGLKQKPIVILITAYKQYALESYALDVVDYLVKPVALDRFIKACNKAQELYQLKKYASDSQAESPTVRPDYIFVNVGFSLQKVLLENMLYIEALRYYVNIHLIDRPTPLLTRATMKSVEAYLPPETFIRIHKSYIVATRQIQSLQKNSLTLNTGIELPIGDIYKPAIQKLVKDHLG